MNCKIRINLLKTFIGMDEINNVKKFNPILL